MRFSLLLFGRAWLRVLKPSRAKAVRTFIVVVLILLLYPWVMLVAISEVHPVWISPLVFPTVLTLPECIKMGALVEADPFRGPLCIWLRKNVLPPGQPMWLIDKPPYLISSLLEYHPLLFCFLIVTNLSYWYVIVCSLPPAIKKVMRYRTKRSSPHDS